MNEADYDLIEQYIEGRLEKEELIHFENRLKTDTQLVEELTLRKDMEHFLEIKKEKDALRKELPNLSKSFFQEPEKEAKVILFQPFYKKKTFLFGSVATILLLFFMIQFLRPTNSLYEQYKGEYTLALAERSSGELNLTKLEKEFNVGNYNYAKGQLELYLAKNTEDMRAQIGYGISLMELNEIKQAQNQFLIIYNKSKTSSLKNTAAWYLALSYLKEENFADTRKYLKEIKEGRYLMKAKEILKKI